MATHYDHLTHIYHRIGFGTFSQQLAPKVIDYAQRNGWMGRQVIDLGTGAGDSLEWIAQHGYIVTGVDHSSAMLEMAKQNFSSKNLQASWLQEDIRKSVTKQDVDLVLALDVLTEMDTLRELEAVFQVAHSILQDGRWFIFDVHTIAGILARNTPQTVIAIDDEDMMVIYDNSFDYDRQIQERTYQIFEKQEDLWKRSEITRRLRAYPIQAITALLKRSGFEVAHLLNTNLTTYENTTANTHRVVMMAIKQ